MGLPVKMAPRLFELSAAFNRVSWPVPTLYIAAAADMESYFCAWAGAESGGWSCMCQQRHGLHALWAHLVGGMVVTPNASISVILCSLYLVGGDYRRDSRQLPQVQQIFASARSNSASCSMVTVPCAVFSNG
jgi:hypothetical protein